MVEVERSKVMALLTINGHRHVVSKICKDNRRNADRCLVSKHPFQGFRDNIGLRKAALPIDSR